jgi:hypothetical protein
MGTVSPLFNSRLAKRGLDASRVREFIWVDPIQEWLGRIGVVRKDSCAQKNGCKSRNSGAVKAIVIVEGIGSSVAEGNNNAGITTTGFEGADRRGGISSFYTVFVPFKRTQDVMYVLVNTKRKS